MLFQALPGSWGIISHYASIRHTFLSCPIIEAILVLAAYSLGSDVPSGADRNLDINFGLQIFECSSLVSVLFSVAFEHLYISFFHLLGFVTPFYTAIVVLFQLHGV